MNTFIPSTAQIRQRLKDMPISGLQELALASGVPLPTLQKIRFGTTGNPGLETVRKIFPYLPFPKAA